MHTALITALASGAVSTTAAPADLRSMLVATVEICHASYARDEPIGPKVIGELGYQGSYMFGFQRAIEKATITLDVKVDEGCWISIDGDVLDFGSVVDELARCAQEWDPPLKVYDYRYYLDPDDRPSSLRTFIGWQSDDKSHNQVLLIDEPAPKGESRAGYVVVYKWFEQ